MEVGGGRQPGEQPPPSPSVCPKTARRPKCESGFAFWRCRRASRPRHGFASAGFRRILHVCEGT